MTPHPAMFPRASARAIGLLPRARGALLSAAFCAGLPGSSRAPAQVVPVVEPVPSRAYVTAGGSFPLPFQVRNLNERRVTCMILFNFREMPVWKGTALLDPLECLSHTATIEARHFVFDRRSVRARLAAAAELMDETATRPIEAIFAPLLPLQPQCRYRIRGQHCLDAPAPRTDLLAEVALVPEGPSLRCRFVNFAAADATWEVLYQPLPPQGPPPEAARLVVRRGPNGAPVIEPAAGRLPEARIESPMEGGDGRLIDLVFPPGSSEAVSLQTILWVPEGDKKHAYCPFTATIEQARDPAYAPELVPRPIEATHRVWVRAGAP